MDIGTVRELLNAKIVCGENDLKGTVETVCSSDLMSDVLTQSVDDMLLLTGLATPQTIRTAEMADIEFIVFVRNKQVTEEMIEIAEDSGIVLLSSEYSMFRACGVLYEAGLPPIF